MPAEMTLTSHRTSGAPQTIMALGAAGVVMLLAGAAYAQSPSGIARVVAAGAAPELVQEGFVFYRINMLAQGPARIGK